MGRAVALLGLLVGVAAVGLQFAITVPASLQAGRTLVGTLVLFFTFFTILTNILVTAVYAARLSERTQGLAGWLSTPPVAAGAAVAIAVVGIVYAVVLAQLWQPQGLFKVADVMLHYIAPILFIVWWGAFGRDGTMSWRDVPRWLVYPFAYLVVALTKGLATGEYPYPFLDLGRNGASGVALASLGVFALFLLISALVVLADRVLPAPRH